MERKSKIDTKEYIERNLKISDKNSDIVPLVLNGPQQKLYDAIMEQAAEQRPQRVIILKARQMGFSTVTEAMIFSAAARASNVSCGIVAHKEGATANLFRMSKRYYDHLPGEERPKTKTRNARELVFADLNSSIKCMTAGGEGVGRSDTYHMLHISEYAFWKGDKKETLVGLLQSVPATPGSLVVIESTANGYDDFKDMWDAAVAGENNFAPVFCAWWEMPDYRMNYDGFHLTDEEREIKDAYGLDPEQIAWRRWCLKNNCGGDRERFRQEYPANPHEAFVSSGASVFNKEILINRLRRAPEPLKRGYFEYDCDGRMKNIRWVDDKNGYIKIYREAERGRPYVIGGDTAGEGSDFFTGMALDNTTGEQVAVLRHRFDEDLYAKQMYCLGKYYNDALLGIESNFSTYPIRELERLRYFRQYTRERVDAFTGKREKRYGFKTTLATRPLLVSGLVEVARETPELINDRRTLEEMLTFVKNERGKAEAMAGKHDDCVMGLMIAHEIRGQQSCRVRGPRGKDASEREMEEVLGFGQE